MKPDTRAAGLGIRGKILLIALSFSLPIGVLVYLMVASIDANITVARTEQAGDAYLKPLMAALDQVQRHQTAAWECEREKGGCSARLEEMAGRVSSAFEMIRAADVRYGTLLKFTPEELAKRGREHQTAQTVSAEWSRIAASRVPSPQPDYDHLVSDLRTMITHAGDTSNLILDPDLDSYYLMDATLVGLPQTQERISKVALHTRGMLEKGVNETGRVETAVSAAQLAEDQQRIASSTHTALNEDANFYGPSPSLAARVPGALGEYETASSHFQDLTKLASVAGSKVDLAEYRSAAIEAQQAAFAFWTTATEELDRLLDARIRHYQGVRMQSLFWSALALLIAGGLAFYFMQSITGPLGSLMRSLGPGATLLGECVSRISEVSKNQTVDPVEAQIICGELDAHAESMREAVLELARHVSGAQQAPTPVDPVEAGRR